jgi:hypothetical protein
VTAAPRYQMVRYREDATTFASADDAAQAYEAFLDSIMQVYRRGWDRDEPHAVQDGVQLRAWGYNDPCWLQRVEDGR